MNALLPTHTASPPACQQLSDRAFYALLTLVFIVAFGLRCGYMAHKNYIHLDESSSIILSTYNSYGYDKQLEDGVMLTGNTLRRMSYKVSSGLDNLGRELFLMRMDSRDLPHTNLYYSLYRLSLSGLDTWNMDDLLRRGFLLNMCLFTLSFLLVFKTARIVFEGDKCITLAAVVVAFMNPATISAAIFMRPYHLQGTLFAALALMTVWYVRRIGLSQSYPHYGIFMAHAFAVGLCLLSGYFSLLYIPLLGLIVLFACLSTRQYRYIPYFVALIVLGMFLAWALYASFMVGLFADRGAEALEKASLLYLLNNAGQILQQFVQMYRWQVISIGGLAALLGAAYCSRGRIPASPSQTHTALYMLAACFAWSCISFILAPYKDIRYIMPAVPLILLFACALLRFARFRIVWTSLFVGGVLILLFTGKIAYFKTTPPPLPFRDAPYVVSFSSAWRTAAILPYLPDAQKVVFYNNCNNLQSKYQNYPGSVLLVDADQFQLCRMDEIHDLRKLNDATFFSTYSMGPEH